jgi:protein gp37
MGCTGCCLWLPAQGIERCYAGTLTKHYAGRKGWPLQFEQPIIFPERIAEHARWKNLTGAKRPDKPWLDGYPRVVFLNDMGDTFTEGLPLMWLEPYIETLESLPNIYIILTKRPKRMVQFFATIGRVPQNFWLLTSITSPKNLGRAYDLLLLKEAFPTVTLGLSLAPLWDDIPGLPEGMDWTVTEGESGDQTAFPSHPDWFRNVRDLCGEQDLPYFHKQNGAWAHQSQLTDDLRALIRGGAEMGIQAIHRWPDGTLSYYTGRNGAGRLLDGQQHNGMPRWQKGIAPCTEEQPQLSLSLPS